MMRRLRILVGVLVSVVVVWAMGSVPAGASTISAGGGPSSEQKAFNGKWQTYINSSDGGEVIKDGIISIDVSASGDRAELSIVKPTAWSLCGSRNEPIGVMEWQGNHMYKGSIQFSNDYLTKFGGSTNCPDPATMTPSFTQFCMWMSPDKGPNGELSLILSHECGGWSVGLSKIEKGTSTDPSNLREAVAANLMKFMKAYGGKQHAYTRVIRIGNRTKYQGCVQSVDLAVNPGLSALAQYDSGSNRITFAHDPIKARKTGGAAQMASGMSTWHECTHYLEFASGQWAWFTQAWAEHNAEFMTYIVGNGLPKLEMMEKRARGDAPIKLISSAWVWYWREVGAAGQLPEPATYPPTYNDLRTMFGFNAQDREVIHDYYVSGRAIKGRAGKRLMKAVLAADRAAGAQ